MAERDVAQQIDDLRRTPPACAFLQVTATPYSLAAWQKNIGYVPQHVFLSNGTIVENIAFGLPMEEINMDRVVYVAQLAQIDKFIRELPEQFSTIVGERGVKLSGGERQRIGIARALYRRPKVIVLDEATSALDNLTESAVVSAIDEISRNTTLIVIAHRFRTVQGCDRIIMLESGRVVCDGSYKELIASSEEFREMAGVKASPHSYVRSRNY